MRKNTAAERVFLSRAEAVTEKKRTRAAHYEQHIGDLLGHTNYTERSINTLPKTLHTHTRFSVDIDV